MIAAIVVGSPATLSSGRMRFTVTLVAAATPQLGIELATIYDGQTPIGCSRLAPNKRLSVFEVEVPPSAAPRIQQVQRSNEANARTRCHWILGRLPRFRASRRTTRSRSGLSEKVIESA